VRLFSEYHVIILTETWLNSNIDNSELGLNDYYVYRGDRSLFTSDKTDGGGVIVLVKKTVKCFQIIPINNSYEQVIIKIQCGRDSLIVAVVYIPPSSSVDTYSEYFLSLQDSLTNFSSVTTMDKVIVLGDFNVPGYEWDEDAKYSRARGHHSSLEVRAAVDVLSSFCIDYNLFQKNIFKNKYGNILDLCLTNIKELKCKKSIKSIFECDRSHDPLDIELNINSNLLNHNLKKSELFDFKRANVNEIIKSLELFKESCFSNGDLSLNDLTSKMQTTLNDAINKFVPKISLKSDNFPNWYSNELRSAIINKKIYHLNYKMYDSNYYKNLFKNHRSLVKTLTIRDRKKSDEMAENNIKTNPSYFYKYVNSSDKSRNLPGSMRSGPEVATNYEGIANLFAKKFGSVYKDTDLSGTPIDINILVNDHISTLEFNIEEVQESIMKLDENSSPGPDNIHPLLVKKCVDLLAPMLVRIFNDSVKSGVYPEVWKLSYVKPLHKSGDVADVGNYRPISKYCVFAKIFDSLVSGKLLKYIIKYILLNQHGFMKDRSTSTNLCTYVSFLVDNVVSGSAVDSIYTDFSRAFDSVNVPLLIRKLKHYGVRGKLLEWFSSMLTGRTQRVIVNGCLSEIIYVDSGVGQGSHLGPILFLIFINDIGDVIRNAEFLLFADDLKLYKNISSHEDRLLLQDDLNNVYNWSLLNGLPLNIGKCNSISFGRENLKSDFYVIGDNLLKNVNQIKDLGVIIDDKLSFSPHLYHVQTSAMRSVNFIKRFARNFKDKDTFRSLYFSFVYPRLTYCVVVWRPYVAGQVKMQRHVLHEFVRYASYKVGRPMSATCHNYGEILTFLNIPDVESSMIGVDYVFLHKLHSGVIDCPALLDKFNFRRVERDLRFIELFEVPKLTSKLFMHSTPIRLSILGNKYHSEFDLLNSSLYELRRFVKSKYLYY